MATQTITSKARASGKVPHTDLEPVYSGKPVVLKTTVTFDLGAPISSLTGVTLTSKIWSDTGVIITGSIVVVGATVTMTFSGATLVAGNWQGQLGYSDDMLATFDFEVIRTI